jgi:diadenosine tetraphosphate (Ap4A) HIT family hydrolase
MAITTEICREGDWSVILPAEGLASGSIYLQPIVQENSSYGLFVAMQKVAQFWEENGVNNYLSYTNSREEGWEMVPYPGLESSGWDVFFSYARQVEVMTRVIFGRYQRGEVEQEQDCAVYQDIASVEVREFADDQVGADVFCKQEVLDKQQIWEGRSICVLHDYAPLGEDKLHFLIVPKAHKERFTELSSEEFGEMQEVASRIIELYPDYICYRYHKTGELAGQSVKHFHEHLVFVKPQNEWQGQLGAYLRMVKPPIPLGSEELKERVEEMRAKLFQR